MKSEKFGMWFLLVAVVLFIASGRNMVSSIILILAALYVICEVIPKLWRWIKDANR